MTSGQSTQTVFDPVLVVSSYPAPIAHAYVGLGEAASPLDRLFALKDLFEVTLKYCAIVMLQDYVRLKLHSTPVDSAIVQHLAQPQLGHWNHLLREIARCCQNERQKLTVPQLVDFYFEPWGTPRKRGHEVVNELIKFRNKVIGHRARPRDKEANQIFEKTRPLVEEMLTDLRFLADYPLLSCKDENTCEIHMGSALPLDALAKTAITPGEVFLRNGDITLPLFPLLIYEQCHQRATSNLCSLTKFFFFNGGDRKPEYLDYLMSHVKQAVEIAPALQTIVHESKSHLTIEVEQTTHAISSDLVREATGGFVGRRQEEETLLEFVSSQTRGYLTVLGDPGIGKSAMLSRLVLDLSDDEEAQNRSPGIATLCEELRQTGLALAYHVCTRRAPESTNVPTILASLAEQLVKQYGPPATAPQERTVRALMDLARVARSHFSAKALLIIDGVDEVLAGRSAQEQKEILRTLPITGHLPEGVFVLLSSRRGYLEQDPNEVTQLELGGLTRLDIQQMLAEVAGEYTIEERHIDSVQRVSQSNSLYVRMLVNDLKHHAIELEDIERLPHGLEGYFEDFIKRLSIDPAWPALRDTLLLLAIARSHLSVNQVCAITDFTWADVEEAMEDKLQSVLVPASQEIRDYQLFHEKFREFLLQLFSGKASAEVVARLNKHFVREAPPQLRAEGEVTATAHLNRAKERILNYCRRWQEHRDAYALRNLPRHLFDANAVDELDQLLRRTSFPAEKIKRFDEPFLVAQDFRDLTLALVRNNRSAEVIDIALTELGYQRDGAAAGLRLSGSEHNASIRKVVETLLHRSDPAGRTLAELWSNVLERLPLEQTLPPSILNARRVALDVASHLGFDDLLVKASQDRSQTVRTLLVPYLYRYWRRDRDAGWQLMDRLTEKLVHRGGLPNARTIDAYGGLCLAILIYHSSEGEVIDRLRRHWNRNVRMILHLPDGAGRPRTFLLRTGLRFVIFALTRLLRLLMAAQPDFQPINLKEMAASYAHPGEEQQLGLLTLRPLQDPDRDFSEPLDLIIERQVKFGLYLMMVLERMLVLHGDRDPAAMLKALFRLHASGPRWCRQSALYVSFHTLYKAERVEDAWLELYARMTRETILETHATFTTERKSYDLLPHMAWAELVFEKHRPRGHSQFIPEFYQQAKQSGDVDFARRVIQACVILSVAYRRHDLALDSLRNALTESDPKLHEAVVEALANIRFQAEDVVTRFLERENADELNRLAESATPTLKANDIFGWIDEYMNYAMIHSERFRNEIIGAFYRAGYARSLSELLQQILKWVINMSTGEQLLPIKEPTAKQD
jgi:hypothetical protein